MVGLSRAAAVRALEQEGFKAGVQQEFSERVAEGFVSRQAPTGGHQAARGRHGRHLGEQGQPRRRSPARLLRLDGRRRWTTGSPQNDLQGDPRTGRSNAVSEGQVFRQDPAAGYRAQARRHRHLLGQQGQAAGDRAGPDQPDAGRRGGGAGRRRAQARQRHAGDRATTVPAGAVIRQDPPAGEKVDKGSAVSIVVSSGPPTPSPSPTVSPSRSGGAQRLRHAVLARGAGARRARPHGGVPREAQHRPAARHRGQA